MFRHENKEGISYSLAIGIDNKNEEFFTKLGERMAELAFEQKDKIPKLFKPSDLQLVKTTGNGKYKNCLCQNLRKKFCKVNSNLSECKEIDGVYKRKRIDVNELIDEPFKGFCILSIIEFTLEHWNYIGISAKFFKMVHQN